MQKNFPELYSSYKLDDLMVSIPSGEIILRDDRIQQSWKVKIAPFVLAKFPVTQELYESLAQSSPSIHKGNRLPVDNVSWKEAAHFCNLLSLRENLTPCYALHYEEETATFDITAQGYRLPTEAEWQYACQAGTNETRYGNLDHIAWHKENSGGKTHEVGLKAPNAWGLFDMLGNVWEWCSDLYDTEVYGNYRIFRGGGWNDEERGCMATNRRRSHPTFKIDDLGFRIARTV